MDAGIGDITAHDPALDRRLKPVGLTWSTKLRGFTTVAGYEDLMREPGMLGMTDLHGNPDRPIDQQPDTV